ncbi:MAG: ral substrate transporter:Major facilitator superfamily 1 [Paucimonas sp.]|nr:ral substrate transporter:Major facilitator superfamily 1 [Paucimonas sp.]
MTGLILVIFLGALEQTIVGVAAPAILTDLRGLELIAWLVAAYLIAATVATPIYGRLSDMYGRRAVLTFSILLFFFASTGCALAQTMPQLVAFRVLQGLGGGGLISVAQAAIADVVPLRERGRYQGYISGVFAFSSLAGPLVGGYLTHYLSWRWIFWINLPLALIALMVVRHALRHLPVKRAVHRIDYVGAALFTVALTAFLIPVTRAGQGVAIIAPSNIGMLALALAGFAVFVRRERRVAEPLIPLSLLRNRTVAICCATLFICFFQFISLAVLVPLQLQLQGFATAEQAALRLLPLTLSIPFGAFAAGRLMSRSGRYKALQLGGALAASAGTFALAFSSADGAAALLALVVLGVGVGFQFPTSLVATQNAVPPQQIGIATALTSLSRMLGGAVGVAVLTTVLLASLRGMTTENLSIEMLMALAATHADIRQATGDAFFRLYIIAATVSLLSPLLLFTLREQELRGRAGVAHADEADSK